MADLFDNTPDAYDPLDAIDAMLDDVSVDRDAGVLAMAMEDVRRAAVCLRDGRLEKNMAGLGPLWGYFPHAVDVKVGGVSVADKLANPKARADVVRKAWAYIQKYEGGRVSYNRVRQSVKAYCGHHVSNFRPVAARDIYTTLGNAGAVFDPCAGWGGRLLGAAAARCTRYVGVDASRRTVDGLRGIAADVLYPADIRHGAAEDVCVGEGWADIAFTSPPYFDAERYSDDPEQSWMRYPDYVAWRDGFLRGLLARMAQTVKPGGTVALNIADVKKYPLVLDSRAIASGMGLVPRPDIAYILSSIAGKGEKFEPVLVFAKPA
jgi:hypothetical protein